MGNNIKKIGNNVIGAQFFSQTSQDFILISIMAEDLFRDRRGKDMPIVEYLSMTNFEMARWWFCQVSVLTIKLICP